MERTVSVLSDVKNLGEFIEGASLERARLLPGAGQMSLELELTRACPELATVVRRGFMARAKMPWVKSRLTLRRITGVAVQRAADAAVTPKPLLACEAVPGGYRAVVTSPDGLELAVTLEQLDGQFLDVGQPIEP
jgi:hypothetical protein